MGMAVKLILERGGWCTLVVGRVVGGGGEEVVVLLYCWAEK